MFILIISLRVSPSLSPDDAIVVAMEIAAAEERTRTAGRDGFC